MSVVVALALTPFMIKELGQHQYGTWLLITSVAGFLQLLALGAPVANVRYVAHAAARNDTRELGDTLSLFLGGYLMISATSLVLGVGLVALFPVFWDVPEPSLSQLALALVVAQWAVEHLLNWPRSALHAYGEFPMLSLANMSVLLTRLGLMLYVLMACPTVLAVAAVMLFTTILHVLIVLGVLRKRHPHVYPLVKLRGLDCSKIGELVQYSLYVFTMNLGLQVASNSDAIVIAGFVGVSSIPFFAVANSMTVYLADLFGSMGNVMMPEATRSYASGDMDAVRDLCLRWSKIAYSLAVFAGATIAVIGADFLGIWIEAAYRERSGVVLTILTLSLVLYLPLRAVALPILLAIGQHRPTMWALLLTSLLNVGLSILLAHPLGIVGVALGTAVQWVLLAGCLFALITHHLGISRREFLLYAFGRPTCAALALWFAVSEVRRLVGATSFLDLIVIGCASSVVFLVLWSG